MGYSLSSLFLHIRNYRTKIFGVAVFLVFVLIASVYFESNRRRSLDKISKLYFKTFFFDDSPQSRESIKSVLNKVADTGVHPYDGLAALRLAMMSADDMDWKGDNTVECKMLISNFKKAKKKIGRSNPWMQDISTLMLLGVSIDCGETNISNIIADVNSHGFLFKDVANELIAFYYYKQGDTNNAVTYHNLISIPARNWSSEILKNPFLSSFPTRWQIMQEALVQKQSRIQK